MLIKLALALNTIFFVREGFTHALVVRQLSYFRLLIKQALVLKTQALVLEGVSSMRLCRTLKLSRLEMLRACACGGCTSFFLFDSVSVCACDLNRLSSFKGVSSYACGEYTSFAHLGVHWLVSFSRRMTGIVIDTHPAFSRRSTFPPCTWQSGQF